jgi:hypothetical protein
MNLKQTHPPYDLPFERKRTKTAPIYTITDIYFRASPLKEALVVLHAV